MHFPRFTLLLPFVVVAFAAKDVLLSERSLTEPYVNAEDTYNISFFHINDVHARLNDFFLSGSDCFNSSADCVGGYARVQHKMKELRQETQDSLFLNVGDEFQGTLFFQHYGGEKIAETINQLGFDGMTLGNHEFDRGDDVLGEFLSNLTFPILSANIVSSHPVLNRTIKSFHIYEKFGIAVIGVTTETTTSTSKPGEGTQFTDPTTAVQNTINLIRSTTNITRIVAITHIGYAEDQQLAQNTKGLHLIMGGHSHTPLGYFSYAEGPYPTIRKNKDGEEREDHRLPRSPIRMDNTIPQDPDLQAQIDEWRVPFDNWAAEELGNASFFLDQTTCQAKECAIGNFFTDAMLAHSTNTSSKPDFALINAGGMRTSINKGPITRGAILNCFPTGDRMVELRIPGADLWKALEGVVSKTSQYSGERVSSFIQASAGVVMSYDSAAATGSRLLEVTIGGEELEFERMYVVRTVEFLAGGGDNIFLEQEPVGWFDEMVDVLEAYIRGNSPVGAVLEGRIVDVKGMAGGK